MVEVEGKVKFENEATAECNPAGYVAVMRYQCRGRIRRGTGHEILPLNKNLFSQRTLEI